MCTYRNFALLLLLLQLLAVAVRALPSSSASLATAQIADFLGQSGGNGTLLGGNGTAVVTEAVFAQYLDVLLAQHNASWAQAAGGASANCTYASVDGSVRNTGSYVVHLTQAVPAAWMRVIRGVLELLRIEVVYEFANTINAFTVRYSGDEALPVPLLRRLPFIAAIEEDQVAVLHQVESGLSGGAWGLDRVDQGAGAALDGTYAFTKTGKGVHVYIMDGRVDVTHAEFGGRADVVYTTPGLSSGNCEADAHGTHVAGIAAGLNVGIAKEALVHSVVVVGCTENGSTSTIAAAIDWLARNARSPAVVNISLGPKQNADGSYSRSAALDASLAGAIAAGITVVVAAGNDGTNACGGSPAGTPGVIAVGALTTRDARASFSNYGSCVNLWAPGDGIVSSVPQSYAGAGNRPYALKEGTSQASPFVAGMAALLLQDGPAAPADVHSALQALGTPGAVSGTTAGSRIVARAPGSVNLSSTQLAQQFVTFSAGDTVPGIGSASLTQEIVIIVVACIAACALVVAVLYYLYRRSQNRKLARQQQQRVAPQPFVQYGLPQPPPPAALWYGQMPQQHQPQQQGSQSVPLSPNPLYTGAGGVVLARPYSYDAPLRAQQQAMDSFGQQQQQQMQQPMPKARSGGLAVNTQPAKLIRKGSGGNGSAESVKSPVEVWIEDVQRQSRTSLK